MHWRYPAGEWQSFCQAEAKRIRDRDIPMMLMIFLPVAVIMMGFAWYKYDPAHPGIFDLRIGMLILLALVAAILFAIVLGRAAYYLRVARYEYEVFVGGDGFYEVFRKNGELRREHKVLFGAEYDLGNVAIRKEAAPAYLALFLRGDKGGTLEKHIPIPSGHGPEAERALKALRALVR